MITLLKFLVMAVAALAEKAFLADLHPADGEHPRLALPRGRLHHLTNGAAGSSHEADSAVS
jgi:hypothetical protein